MILALLLATASAPPPDPGPLRASLLQARGPIASMEACAGVKPRYEARYARAFAAYIRVAAEADSLFGGEPTLETLDGPTVPAGCGDRAFADYEAAAEADLAEARRRLGEVTALMPGMWLGTMRICREQVVEAVIKPVDEDVPLSGLKLTLVPALKPRLLTETKARLNKPISVRIDGAPVMAPTVYEPISAGEIMLSAPSPEELERVRAAALRPC